MEFDLDKGLAVLTRTPATLRELLAGLPSPWTSANEGRDTWSPQDVVGHLIHGEDADWSLQRLLDRFAELRAEGVATVRQWHLSREQLALRGRHPELGQVTLSQLLASWVVHDLGHIAQISRVMAKQYSVAVGPWKAYLPVLTR